MAKRLAVLLRRWADRLDPPAVVVPAPVPASPPAEVLAPMVEFVPRGVDRFVTLLNGKELYDGRRGAEASRRFVHAKVNKQGRVEFWHNGELRDWWPR